MNLNRKNINLNFNNKKYNFLEEKQIKKTLLELEHFIEKMNMNASIEMQIQKKGRPKVSIQIKSHNHSFCVSKSEKNLLKALFKVRKIVIRKLKEKNRRAVNAIKWSNLKKYKMV